MGGHRPEGSDESEQSLWAAAGAYTGYGLTWALSVLLFLLGGWWVDEKIGTTPLMMIVGAFVGAGAGFYSLYRHVILGMGPGRAEDSSASDPPIDGEVEEGRRREPGR